MASEIPFWIDPLSIYWVDDVVVWPFRDEVNYISDISKGSARKPNIPRITGEEEMGFKARSNCWIVRFAGAAFQAVIAASGNMAKTDEL